MHTLVDMRQDYDLVTCASRCPSGSESTSLMLFDANCSTATPLPLFRSIKSSEQGAPSKVNDIGEEHKHDTNDAGNGPSRSKGQLLLGMHDGT